MGYRRRYRNYGRKNDDLFSELIYLLIVGIFNLGKMLGVIVARFGIYLYDNKDSIKDAFKINSFHQPSENPLVVPQEIRTIREPEEENILPQTKGAAATERYTLRPTLITPAEQNFLDVLTKVIDGHYIIESQVQLSRIVTPTDSNKNYTAYGDFNRIKAKSIDFVLYDNLYRPILCIELDDRSHLRWDRIKRDMFVDEVMKSVGLRILHVPVSYSYDSEKLSDGIFLHK